MPRQDTKKSIFEAAVTVFAKYGYKGALMDTIAEEAGVAKGTLYYHFKSKEEIFVFTMEEGIREIVDGVRSEAEGMDNIIAKLTTICRVQLEMMKSKADFFRVLFSQLMGLEDRQSSLRLRLRDYILYLQGIMEEGIRQGVLRDRNAALMAYSFFGTILSSAVYEALHDDKMSVREVASHITGLALEGIAS